MKVVSLEINNLYKLLSDPEPSTRALFEVIDASGKFPITGGELSIVFVDDATISQIHADFMDDATPTDVITFPANPEMDSAGEIIVSVDHAHCRALELKKCFSHELTLYLVHGWLHLAGYDDKSKPERAEMRKAEERAIALLEDCSEKPEFSLC